MTTSGQAHLLNADYLTKVADALPVADGRSKSKMQFSPASTSTPWPSNSAATNLKAHPGTALENAREHSGYQELYRRMAAGASP